MNNRQLKQKINRAMDAAIPDVLGRVKDARPQVLPAERHSRASAGAGNRAFRLAYALVFAAAVFAAMFTWVLPDAQPAAAVTFDFGNSYSAEILLSEDMEITKIHSITEGAKPVVERLHGKQLALSDAVAELLNGCAYQDFEQNNGDLLQDDISDSALILSVATDNADLRRLVLAELSGIEGSLAGSNAVGSYIGVLSLSSKDRMLAGRHNLSAGMYALIRRIAPSDSEVVAFKHLSPGKLINLLEEQEAAEAETAD